MGNGSRQDASLSDHVLILNQSYEPLTVCTVRRSILLVLLGKVEIVEPRDGQMLRSANQQWVVPSVVRLAYYIHIPRKRVILSRKNIIKRDGHRCQYCGVARAPMTVDHIVPRRHGGTDSWENMVCACIKCNHRKGDRAPEAAHMPLRRHPKRPSHITFIHRFTETHDPRWKRYLFQN